MGKESCEEECLGEWLFDDWRFKTGLGCSVVSSMALLLRGILLS